MKGLALARITHVAVAVSIDAFVRHLIGQDFHGELLRSLAGAESQRTRSRPVVDTLKRGVHRHQRRLVGAILDRYRKPRSPVERDHEGGNVALVYRQLVEGRVALRVDADFWQKARVRGPGLDWRCVVIVVEDDWVDLLDGRSIRVDTTRLAAKNLHRKLLPRLRQPVTDNLHVERFLRLGSRERQVARRGHVVDVGIRRATGPGGVVHRARFARIAGSVELHLDFGHRVARVTLEETQRLAGLQRRDRKCARRGEYQVNRIRKVQPAAGQNPAKQPDGRIHTVEDRVLDLHDRRGGFE